MEPRKSRASTSRSRLAGGGEEQATASIPARATKSSRVCSKPGPAPQATARDKTGPKVEMWGDRSPKESSETYCSRMTARFTEYDQCGRKLRVAREEIRLARNLANKGAKKNRPDLKKRIDALKVEIKELEERRRIILEGSGLFKEKMENDGRFTTMKSSGNYKTQLWDKQAETFLPSTPGLGMHVEVKDPDGKIIMSRQYGSEGRFTFTSHTPGEHQICLHSNSTRMSLFAGGKLRVHLDIQIGEHTNNYPEIAAKDKLTELQLRVRQLLDQVEQIQKEQNYQRYREERFRLTSESTNQRVLWWSIAQTLILILTGIWQMRHLKSFFEAKKLV